MNELKVKVCGMKNPNNLKALAALPVDFVGMIFHPSSPRFVNDKEPHNLTGFIPKSIAKVGVYVNANLPYITQTARSFDLQYIQLHGNESVEFIRQLKRELPTILTVKAFAISNSNDFELCSEYLDEVDFFLFDTKTPLHGGSGLKFDWQILSAYTGSTPFFLSGGISPEDAPMIQQIKHPRLHAVDVNSRFESAPGFKDIAAVEVFIRQLKEKNHE